MLARRRDFFSQLLFAAFAVRFEVQGSFEVCSERQQISASLFVIKRMRQADRRAVWYFKVDHGNIIYPRSFRKFRRADSPSPEPGVPAGIS